VQLARRYPFPPTCQRQKDLIGAVHQPRLAGVAVDPFENRILRISTRAVDLDRDAAA